MIKKLAAPLVLVAFVALASMGISYATDEYAEFTFMDSWDNESVKEVGHTSGSVDNAGVLNIFVTNAYPGYSGYVWFQITHIGENGAPRIYLTNIDPDYPSSIMDIVVTDLNEDPIPKNTFLDPGQSLDGMVNVTILQEAGQAQSYGFNVVITFKDAPV